MADEGDGPATPVVCSLARSGESRGTGNGSRMTGDCHVRLCVQECGHVQQGRPAEARIRSLVAWIAKWKETETLKPIDDAIERMVANDQAVAQANAYVASKVNRSGGRARNREGEGRMTH